MTIKVSASFLVLELTHQFNYQPLFVSLAGTIKRFLLQRIRHWRKHGGAPPEGVGQAVGQAAAIIRKATERQRGGFAGGRGGFGGGRGAFGGGPGGFGGGSGRGFHGNDGGGRAGFGRGAPGGPPPGQYGAAGQYGPR
jgi:hypothetical protein